MRAIKTSPSTGSTRPESSQYPLAEFPTSVRTKTVKIINKVSYCYPVGIQCLDLNLLVNLLVTYNIAASL